MHKTQIQNDKSGHSCNEYRCLIKIQWINPDETLWFSMDIIDINASKSRYHLSQENNDKLISFFFYSFFFEL